MKMTWKQYLPIMALLGLLVLPAGCGKVEETVAQVNAVITAYTDPPLSSLPTKYSSALGGASRTPEQFRDLLRQLVGSMQDKFVYYQVKTYKVTYTVDTKTLTGLVAVPVDVFNPQRLLRLPMISLQHPTQVLRSQSPSLVSQFGDEELTVPYGIMLAAMGYIVVMPDYPGMGDNYDVHPYCMTDLSKSVIGLIDAAGNGRNGSQPWYSFAVWDTRLFLIGFSEGGYATMVTAKDIQLNQHNPTINLQGVAALDGPYDLSGTMRNLMLTANQTFSAPYFLPYVVAGYSAAYGSMDSSLQFNNAVLASSTLVATGFNDQLYSMLDGSSTSDAISTMMKTQSAYPTAGPKSILTDAYKAALGNYTSTLYAKLQINNAYGGWTPQTSAKIMLYHNKKDDLVPFGNYSAVHFAWGTTNSNITYKTVDNPLATLGSVHATSLIPAYIEAAKWIHGLAYP